MTCDAPIRECLAWHIKPKLANAKIDNGGLRLRARCPACGDPRSLTVSAGQQLRATWNCYAGCSQPELREALMQAGLPASCLPRSRTTDKAVGQTVAAVIQQGTPADRAQTLLRVYAIAVGHVRWPRGAELEKLAADAGVSRRDAYRAKGAGPLVPHPPGTSSTYRGD